jgi:hypothetical protein
MTRGERIAAAALALVGTPFQLHGRSEAGLDCVGLALLAAERAGCGRPMPLSYGMRGGDAERYARGLDAAGLRRVREARDGDLALVHAGPAQFHLLVRTTDGYVHAHAGLGAVVEMPGESPWPVIGIWRV